MALPCDKNVNIEVLEDIIEIQVSDETVDIYIDETLPGKPALINGVNTLTLVADKNITLIQEDGTATLNVDDVLEDIEQINFDITAIPLLVPLEPGQMRWNSVDSTLDLGLYNGVTLQLGQESNIPARNDESFVIPDGTPVFVSGGQGQRLSIRKAYANDVSKSYVIGVATQDILPNATGYITTFGLVHGINMGAIQEGSGVWLGVDGSLTGYPPALPNKQSFVGWCVKEGNKGNLYVFPKILEDAGMTPIYDVGGYYSSTNVEDALQEIAVEVSSIQTDKTYTHTQIVSQATWSIQHNLNKYPAVTVIDSADNVVIGDVDYVSLDEITVTFGYPFGGKAYLN